MTRRPAKGRRPPGVSFVITILHGTLQIAVHVPFGDGVFFVVEPLAAHQVDLDLGEGILGISARHNRPATLGDLAAQLRIAGDATSAVVPGGLVVSRLPKSYGEIEHSATRLRRS